MVEERKNKGLLIGVLCATILFMSVGFAAISTRLTIQGTATISDTWNVQITDITKKDSSANVEEVEKSFSATTANFSVSLKEPGDYAVYTITVRNTGSIDAVLNDITETISEGGSDAIQYTLTPSTESVEGSTLANKTGTHTFDLRAEYLSTAIGEAAPEEGATKTITVTLDYKQKTE